MEECRLIVQTSKHPETNNLRLCRGPCSISLPVRRTLASRKKSRFFYHGQDVLQSQSRRVSRNCKNKWVISLYETVEKSVVIKFKNQTLRKYWWTNMFEFGVLKLSLACLFCIIFVDTENRMIFLLIQNSLEKIFSTIFSE